MKCPECGGESVKTGKRDHRQRWLCKREGTRFTTRLCKLCGGPVMENNATGICSVNPACMTERRKFHDRLYDAKRRQTGKPRLKPPVVNKDHPWEIPDDGIVDHTAIDIAVEGKRKVRLTRPEQLFVIRRMLMMGYGWKDLCDHIGIGAAKLKILLDEMGYEAITDPTQTGAKYSKRKLITRKDRPRGPKMLEIELHDPTDARGRRGA